MRKVAMMALLMATAGGAAAQDAVRVHTETSFDVTVRAPMAEAARLFTPEGERVWAGKQWDPHYVYASGEERDGAGAVFTIDHGPLKAVWVVALRDVEARHFEYVYSMAGLLVTTIDVRFEAAADESTTVHVKYARTAVSSDGDEHVRTLTEHDQSAGTDWQKAIDKYLAARPTK